MAVAMMYPDGQQGKRNLPNNLGCSTQYITHARTVIKWAPCIYQTKQSDKREGGTHTQSSCPALQCPAGTIPTMTSPLK
jgi:hypothetical protein